jgi:hypothetical protein
VKTYSRGHDPPAQFFRAVGFNMGLVGTSLNFPYSKAAYPAYVLLSIGFVCRNKEPVFPSLHTKGLDLQNSGFVEVEDPQ